MAFFERTTEEIVSASLEKLSRRTNITQLSPGSKARVLTDIVSEEQGNQHVTFDENLMQVFLKYADLRFLEFFGDMMNEPIIGATHAVDETNNFMFYVSSGTFGDINGGAQFVIPAGGIVHTVPADTGIVTPGIEEQPSIEYTIIEDVVAEADASFVYAPIRARIEGSFSNVPRNVLLRHNVTGYLLSSDNLLKCTNNDAISSGEDRESAESYRFRLQNLFRARQLAVPVAVRLAALAVPGVSDIKEVLCEQGPGTFSLYILSSTPTTSSRLLEEVSRVVAQVTGYGNRQFILAPEPLGLELICKVIWSPRATREDISRGYIVMRDSLGERLSRVTIGEEVTFAELRDVMLAASEFAVAIGEAEPNKFEEKYVYRRDPLTGGVTRNLVVGDKITPLYNERLILETSGTHHGIRFLTRQ